MQGPGGSGAMHKRSVDVVIVSGCTIFAQGLKQTFSRAGFRTRLCFRTVEELFDARPLDCLPDAIVIVLDEFSETVELDLQRIERRWPSSKIMILAQLIVCRELIRLIGRIDGVFLRNQGIKSLVKALDLVLLGERIFPAAALEADRSSSEMVFSGTRTASCGRLSEREREVLRLLAGGNSNKIIARQLGIAEATVKVHVKAILRKVNAKNRTQAALRAPSMLENSTVVRMPEQARRQILVVPKRTSGEAR